MFISLGAACDAANAIKRLGLRRRSLPFDWLCNLYHGLDAVTDMIEKGFEMVGPNSSYILAKHYRFSQEKIVYKAYPRLVHMHSNPLACRDDHEALLRRIERFQRVLNGRKKVNFVYYRCYEEDSLGGLAETAGDSLNLMLAEAKRFLAVLERMYPDFSKSVKITLVLETSERIPYDTYNSKTPKPHPAIMGIGHVLTRNDESKADLKRCRRDWRLCILRLSGIPWHQQFMIEIVMRPFVFISKGINKLSNTLRSFNVQR